MPHITVLGDHNESSITHRALDATLAQLPDGITASWVAPGSPIDGDALWIAPGSPYSDDAAVLDAIAAARAAGMPLLGTCGGFQYILLSLLGADMSRHAESTPDAESPLLAPLACRVDGEHRLVTPTDGGAPFPALFFCGYAPSDAAVSALRGARVTAYGEGIGAVALEGTGPAFLQATLYHPQMAALEGRPLPELIKSFTLATTGVAA
jgi:hypothetical protein